MQYLFIYCIINVVKICLFIVLKTYTIVFEQDNLELTITYTWPIVKKYNYIRVKPLWISKKTEYSTSTILRTTTFKIGLEVSCLLCFASLNFYSLKQLYFFIVSWTFKSRGFLKQEMSFALFSSLCWINWLRTYKEVLLSFLQYRAMFAIRLVFLSVMFAFWNP